MSHGVLRAKDTKMNDKIICTGIWNRILEEQGIMMTETVNAKAELPEFNFCF